MSSQDTTIEAERQDMTDREGERDNDSVASKLSKELNNWRRRRTAGRPKRNNEGQNPGFESDSARTIKVRGHETLVIRKPKLATKPPATERSGR
jgi:hypothetical protein